MNIQTFLNNFGLIAEAPNGVGELRVMILQFVFEGLFTESLKSDRDVKEYLEEIYKKKNEMLDANIIKPEQGLPELDESHKYFKIPDTWAWTRLIDICSHVTDIEHKMPKSVENGYKFISAKDISELGDINLTKNIKTISKEDFNRLSKRICPQRGDIIFTRIGTLGRAAIVRTDELFLPSYSCCVIRPIGIDVDYLRYYLSSGFLLSKSLEQSKGIGVPDLGIKPIKCFGIPIAPLEDQKRIVAKVDQLMALCDKLEIQQKQKTKTNVAINNAALDKLLTGQTPDEFNQHWQRIANNFPHLYDNLENLTKLRASILQLAVQGKLVTQNYNDEPASVLLKKIAEEKDHLVKEGKIKKQKALSKIKDEEKPFELPNSWEWIRIWDIAEVITSGSRDWAKYYSNSGAIFVTMGNLSRGNYDLRMDNIRYVKPPKNGEGSRTKLEANDLLISITGDVGNLGLIPENFGEAYINQHTCLLRFMPICQNRYFPELLRSPLASIQFNAPQRGVKNSFRLGDVGEMIIPLPPLAEQKRIVVKVDQLMTFCDQLESQIKQAQTTQQKLTEATVKSLAA